MRSWARSVGCTSTWNAGPPNTLKRSRNEYRTLSEARETDEWRRWANAGIQEELCKRMEALRDSKDGADLPEIARQLRDLRRQWKAVSVAPMTLASLKAGMTRYSDGTGEIRRPSYAIEV